MNGRMAGVIAGGIALVILGTVAVASASTPSGGGGGGPPKPDEEDCDTLNAALQNRQAARNQLLEDRKAIQGWIQAAEATQDYESAAQLQAQLNGVNQALALADADIADLNTRLGDCS